MELEDRPGLNITIDGSSLGYAFPKPELSYQTQTRRVSGLPKLVIASNSRPNLT